MAEKKYYWLKLKKDFFSALALKKLRKLAGGDTYTVIYLKLMLLSIEKQGLIEFQHIEDTIEDELALILDEIPDNIRMTIQFMKSTGLLDEISSDKYFISEVITLIGTETSSAERVRKHRANHAGNSLQCNGTVTDGNNMKQICNEHTELKIEIEKDIDIDIDIDKKYNVPTFDFEKEIKNHIYKFDEHIASSIKNFYQHRIELSNPFYKTGFKLFLQKVENFIKAGYSVCTLIEKSIICQWQDIYEPKDDLNDNNMFNEEIQSDNSTHEEKLSKILDGAYENWVTEAKRLEFEMTENEWNLIYGYVMSMPSLLPHEISTNIIQLQKWSSKDEARDIENAILAGNGHRRFKEPRIGYFIDQKTNKPIYGFPYVQRRLTQIKLEKEKENKK